MAETWTVVLVVLACAAFACAVCLLIARRQRALALSEIDSVEGLLGAKGLETFPRGTALPYTAYHGHFMGGYFKIPSEAKEKVRVAHGYTVFDVKLRAGEHFDAGHAQPWDRASRLAQHNFGEGKNASLLRAAIRNENDYLFNGRSRGSVRYVRGEINTLARFLALIQPCGKQQGTPTCAGADAQRPVFYSFVLLNNGIWRFGQTLAYPLAKGLLKHAVLSDVASDVLFAGEFYFDVASSTLIVDNCSEAYNVDKHDLPKFAALLERSLPGLSVDAVDKEDARHAGLRDGGRLAAGPPSTSRANPSFKSAKSGDSLVDAHQIGGYKPPPPTDAAGMKASAQALMNNASINGESDEARLLRELEEATQKPPTPPPPHPNMVAIANKDDQTRLLQELEEHMGSSDDDTAREEEVVKV